MIEENINRGEADQPIPTINNNYNRNPLLPRAEEGNTQNRILVRTRKRVRKDNNEQEYYQSYIYNYFIYNKTLKAV